MLHRFIYATSIVAITDELPIEFLISDLKVTLGWLQEVHTVQKKYRQTHIVSNVKK